MSKSHIFLYGLSGKIIQGISFSFSLSSSSVSVSHIFSLLNSFLCSFSSFSTLLLSSSNSSSSSSSVSSPSFSDFLSSSSPLLLAFSFASPSSLFELELDLEFSLFELFESELLSDPLFLLLLDFELLSELEPDFSDFDSESESPSEWDLFFLDCVSLFFVLDFFEIDLFLFLEDELKLELFDSETLLDLEFEILEEIFDFFFEFFETFELFFFSSDWIELDFFWEDLLLFLSLIKEDWKELFSFDCFEKDEEWFFSSSLYSLLLGILLGIELLDCFAELFLFWRCCWSPFW